MIISSSLSSGAQDTLFRYPRIDDDPSVSGVATPSAVIRCAGALSEEV
jgi:hypothetical protein